jgi:hypothetical protein
MLFCILPHPNFAPEIIKSTFMDSIINDASLLGKGTKLLSKKQAAAEFGVTYRTIERWYNCGYLNYVRIGGRVFVSYAEIYRIRDQFIDGQPNGNYMESQIRSLDDVHDRHQRTQGQSMATGLSEWPARNGGVQRPHYCYGARR